MSLLFYSLLALSFAVPGSSKPISFYSLPGLDETTYSHPGNINIGAMVFLFEESLTDHAEMCSDDIKLSSYEIESTETIAYAVDLVNRNPHILPNVSLGFFIRGICKSFGVTLGTSLSFLPKSQSVCTNSTCSVSTANSSSSNWLTHDIIGMIGTAWSPATLPVSTLYGAAQLPIIGIRETSDDFSNKVNHPYFFRLVPPDMYQVQAMLKFISSNGWTYISLIYQDGSHGVRAYERMQQNAGRFGICIATSHRLFHSTKYSDVVSDLLLNYRARVVVLIITKTEFRDLLQAVVDKNATGHFIWIASDAIMSYPGYDYKGIDYDPIIGTLAFSYPASYVPGFYQYLKHQKVSSTNNPWMKPIWEYLFDCSFNEGTCDLNIDILQSKRYKAYQVSSIRIDGVLTLAHAAHNLLSVKCPNARGEEARSCITGDLLRDFLKNTSFEGVNGHIKFDKNQDVEGKYVISQLDYDYFKYYSFLSNANVTSKKVMQWKDIGVYEISTDSLTYLNQNMSWSHLTSLDRFRPWYEDLDTTKYSQSVCSIPCGVGEYKIEKELPCCWECRKCRENEHLVEDNTTCETCPSFMWPDSTSGFTTCIDIPLTYPMFNDPIPVVFISLAVIALVVTASVIVSYVLYRNERVIKASSRDLSAIQLFAIFTGYTTVIIFQAKPSDIMCGAIFFLFCMSFSLLYSPLLIKTVRICRIFKSGQKNEKPRFISPKSQLIFTNCLIAVQVVFCITVYILYWPKAKRTQPIWSEKLVELSCDLTFPGITSFLGYNIILVILCSVFAFKVRSLPDNFNESKFISMCVTTTLLIWLAFIPAYFTTGREFVRVFLLSVGLFLNHSVALMFLFVPKIYAAKFLPSEDFSAKRS